MKWRSLTATCAAWTEPPTSRRCPTRPRPGRLPNRSDETLDVCLKAIDMLSEQAEMLSRRVDAYVEGKQQRKSV